MNGTKTDVIDIQLEERQAAMRENHIARLENP